MKKLTSIIIGLALMALALSTKAQDANTNAPWGPAFDKALQFLGNGSNWMAATYVIHDEGSKDCGAGIALLYNVNDFAGVSLALDWINEEFWMPSANFTLQLPIQIGPVKATPFGRTGIATPVGGAGSDNGTAVAIFGAGLAVALPDISSDNWAIPDAIVADYERWDGLQGNQIRLGFLWKF